MSLTIGGHNGPRIAEVKSVKVHGQPGAGCYVLYIALQAVSGRYESKALISDLSLRVDLESRLHVGVGKKEGSPLIEWWPHTADSQIGFYIKLSGSQLEAIEQVRGLGEIGVSLWLSGVTHTDKGVHDFISQQTFRVPKEEWLRALDHMDYQVSLLFELPLPNETAVSDDIQNTLTKAKSHLASGHYEECVAKCRSVIELLEELREDKKDAQAVAKKYKGPDRKEMTINERMLFLREAIKNITHLGNHPVAEEFSRHQAQSIFGMTIAILSSPEVGLVK